MIQCGARVVAIPISHKDEAVKEIFFLYFPDSGLELDKLHKEKIEQLKGIFDHKWFEGERGNSIGLKEAAKQWFTKFGREFTSKHGLSGLEGGILFDDGTYIVNNPLIYKGHEMAAKKALGIYLSEIIYTNGLVSQFYINPELFRWKEENLGSAFLTIDPTFSYPIPKPERASQHESQLVLKTFAAAG